MWFNVMIIVTVFRVSLLFWKRKSGNGIGQDGRLKLRVGERFQRAFGGKIFQALHIPDTGHRGYQDIDVVLLTHRELYVLAVNNLAGAIKIGNDGCWFQTASDGSIQRHPNAVLELKEKATVLASYIARRGITLPETFFKLRVVFANPSCMPEQEVLLQTEVVSYDEWRYFMKNVPGHGLLGWSEIAFYRFRNRVSAALHQQLNFILLTAPTRDRIELRNGAISIGQFICFKGQTQDLEALKVVKQSKIRQLEAFHRSSLLNFLGHYFTQMANENFSYCKLHYWKVAGLILFLHDISKLCIIQSSPGFRETFDKVRTVCTLRDYRQNVSGQKNMIEMHLRTDLEIVFQIVGVKKPQHFKLKDLVILTLWS